MSNTNRCYYELELGPAISVIVPCLNERQYIQDCVISLLSQDMASEAFEIVIVDGVSNDGTPEILQKLAKQHPEVRLVNNPRRVTPAGMNAGIRAARGRFIAILGAHCHYEPTYLRTCVELLDEHPEASCVGGPILSLGRSDFGKAVAAAMSHPVGIGNARHRHPNYEGYAEGACYPVFRREVFDTIGFYDEFLIRNQDDELNYRLTKQGGKVFLSPRARCTYFVRETMRGLSRQYFEYGYWRVAVLRKHRMPASFRQLVPPTFLVGLVCSLAFAWLGPDPWRWAALVPPLVYVLLLLVAGVSHTRTHGLKVGVLFPIAAATMHVAYAAGFVGAAVKSVLFSTISSPPTNSQQYSQSR